MLVFNFSKLLKYARVLFLTLWLCNVVYSSAIVSTLELLCAYVCAR